LNFKSFHILPINRLILLTSFLVIITCSSFAQDKNYIALSSAVFDILQQDEPSYENRLEFRIGKVKLLGHPFMGVMVNTDGAIHSYLGIYYDFLVANRIYITPSFAPGLYSKRSSKDLQFALVFKSQIEASYRFAEGGRIGISFNHVSNASLGVENPVVESLAITYIIPF